MSLPELYSVLSVSRLDRFTFFSGGGGGFLYLTDEIIIEGAFLFLHSVVSSWFTSGTNTAVFLSNTRNHDVMVADDLYRITML